MGNILIKTPITSDGLQVVLGPDGKIQYREDFADERARKDFDKINTRLPNNLKMIIEDVVPVPPPQPTEFKQVEPEPEFSKAIKKNKLQ